MDSIIRGAVVYLVLLLIFRVAGKRSLAQITTFDAVLLLIISEAIQQAMLDSDSSMTNAFLLVVTLVGIDILMSLITLRSPTLDRLLNDGPLVLVSDGQVLGERLRKARVSEDDVLEHGRQQWGIEGLEQVAFAVLERSGSITVVPRDVPWLRRRPELRAG